MGAPSRNNIGDLRQPPNPLASKTSFSLAFAKRLLMGKENQTITESEVLSFIYKDFFFITGKRFLSCPSQKPFSPSPVLHPLNHKTDQTNASSIPFCHFAQHSSLGIQLLQCQQSCFIFQFYWCYSKTYVFSLFFPQFKCHHPGWTNRIHGPIQG